MKDELLDGWQNGREPHGLTNGLRRGDSEVYSQIVAASQPGRMRHTYHEPIHA